MWNEWRFGKSITLLLMAASLGACGNQAARKEAVVVSEQSDIPVVKVQKLQLKRQLDIPGELRAYQNVAVEAKVQGYVSWIGVDRGSRLKQNDKILTIFCPELDEHVKEEEAKYSTALANLRKGEDALAGTKSRLLEAKARLDADSLTLDRLKQTAAKMPGAVAINDIDVQTKTVESDQDRMQSMHAEVRSGEALVAADRNNMVAALKVLNSVKAMRAYLTVQAPFDGVITERNVHVGSMVGYGEHKEPLLRIQQCDVLRLVAAVPEDAVAGLQQGKQVTFRVPAFPGEDFHGTVARPGYALDPTTRTMPVELNVKNGAYRLEPGMFANVQWPISRPAKTLFVPGTAVATDLKGSFVNVIANGTAKRVPVEKSKPMADMIEIVGDVKEGDEVALTASDELTSGTHLATKLVTIEQTHRQN